MAHQEPLAKHHIENTLVHPSLIGGGERAMAGLPPNGAHTKDATIARSRNRLAQSGVTPTSPWYNALTGTTYQPPVAALPPSTPAPVQAPSVPAGQIVAIAVKKGVAPEKMTDAALAGRIDRAEYTVVSLRNLLDKPSISPEDVVDAVHAAIKHKAIDASEAAQLLGEVGTDPSKIRGKLQDHLLIAMHALVHLVGESRDRASSRKGS